MNPSKIRLEPAEIRTEYSDRSMFYCLMNYEMFPSVIDIAEKRILQEISTLSPSVGEGFSKFLTATDTSAAPSDLRIGSLSSFGTTAHKRATVIRQYAPFALTEFCWLRNVSQAVNCHVDSVSHLFTVYSRFRQIGGINQKAGSYRSLVRSLGLTMPALNSRAFSEQLQIQDMAFVWPVTQLTLALFPVRFLAEIIGYTLAHTYGLSELSNSRFKQTLQADGLSLEYWDSDKVECLAEKQRVSSRAAATEYLKKFPGTAEYSAQLQRIWKGFQLYSINEQRLGNEIDSQIEIDSNAADKVIRLFRSKAKYAQGYHGAVDLGGQSLDLWFKDSLSEPKKFLDSLINSSWFDVENPEQSRFFREFLSPNGPMFGVFDESEKVEILEWVKSHSNCVNTVEPSGFHLNNKRSYRDNNAPVINVRKPKNIPGSRDMFYFLINRDKHRDKLLQAQNIVSRRLHQTKLSSWFFRFPDLCYFNFSHDAFESRISRIYRAQMNAYKPLRGRPDLSRQGIIWGIKQFAPTILVDGCWLQHIANLDGDWEEISQPLWRIYADEVGNGCTNLNHPNIYRNLLQSLSIQLPDIDSRQFCEDPGILYSAYDLPVYLLAISQYPRLYLPEIIGLNLAIELSGLGSGYMRLVETLRYWEIDPTIVSLHLSIDNMSCGHAAIAKDVVGLYLDKILAQSGQGAMHTHWRRIWTGFLSLRFVPGRFSVALVAYYLSKFSLPERLLR